MALPSLVPLAPLADEVYEFKHIKARDDNLAVGKDTWNRLARWAVRWVSDCRWGGSAGKDGCMCAGGLWPAI